MNPMLKVMLLAASTLVTASALTACGREDTAATAGSEQSSRAPAVQAIPDTTGSSTAGPGATMPNNSSSPPVATGAQGNQSTSGMSGLGGSASPSGAGTGGMGAGPAAPAQAPASAPAAVGPTGALPRQDWHAATDDLRLMQVALQQGMTEMTGAMLAEQRASRLAVQALAAAMRRDNMLLQQEIIALAERRGVRLAADADRALIAQLDHADTAHFDHVFANAFCRHTQQKGLALFEHAALHAHDADLRALATRAALNLRHRLEEARSLVTHQPA